MRNRENQVSRWRALDEEVLLARVEHCPIVTEMAERPLPRSETPPTVVRDNERCRCDHLDEPNERLTSASVGLSPENLDRPSDPSLNGLSSKTSMTQRPPPQQSKASRLPSVAAAMLPQKPPRLRRRRASPSLPCPQSSILLSLHHYLTLLLLSLTVFSFLTPSLGRHVIVGQRHIDGFNYPWNPVVNYTQWAATFPVIAGDTLVFQYESGEEVVYEVPSQGDLDDCRLDDARLLCDSLDGEGGRSSDRGGHVRGCRVLVESRTLYLTSKVDHCRAGQRVVIRPRESGSEDVSADSHGGEGSSSTDSESVNDSTSSPSMHRRRSSISSIRSVNVSSSSNNNSSSRSSKKANSSLDLPGRLWRPPEAPSLVSTAAAGGRRVIVGAAAGGYNYPWNPAVNYNAWIAANKLYAGDFVVFKYPAFQEEVVQFSTLADFKSCNFRAAKIICYDSWGAGANGCAIRVTAVPGMYASGLYGHCKAGQKLVVKASARPYSPRTLVVGYMSEQFAWQWNPEAQLVKWANANKVYVGDTLVFKYPPYKDEVYIVPTLRDYNNCVYTNYVSYCNGTDGGGQGCFTNPITSTTYFVSGLYSHCKAANQKIIITPLKPPS